MDRTFIVEKLMYTQCPKCRTVFNVTEEILAIKEGLVRCGDCENVFNATWNLVDVTDESESPDFKGDNDNEGNTSAVSGQPSLQEQEQEQESREDIEEDTESEQPEKPPIVDTVDSTDESGKPAQPAQFNEFLVEETDFELESDEGESLVSDIEGLEEDSISDEEIRRTLRLDEAIDFDRIEADSGNIPTKSAAHQTGHETPARTRPGEPERAYGQRLEPRFGPLIDEFSVNKNDGLLPRRRPVASQTTQGFSPLLRRPAIKLKTQKTEPRSEPADSVPVTIRSDPNVHWVSIPDTDSRGVHFLWATGVLLLLVLMVVQVRFFLVEELYSIPATRPYVSLFCEFVGCKAPLRTDPNQIHIAQTRVDLHPEIPGALRLKINLINKANFAQQYPSMQVSLSDKDGRIVGQRTYRPENYLGEKSDNAMLDPGILAIATINLAHPNENAVGFETTIVSD